MREKVDFYTGLFWLLFSPVTGTEAYRLKLGDIYQPGPGFFPFWTGIIGEQLIILEQSYQQGLVS